MAFRTSEVLAGIGVLVVCGAAASVLLPKSAQSASDHLRQLGEGTLLYATDWDGILPMAMAPRRNMPGYHWSRLIYVPAGWGPDTTPTREWEDGEAFPNSDSPYRRSSKVLWAPEFPVVRRDGIPYETADKLWYPVGFTFNGLLHSYPVEEVADPSRLPLHWQGYGPANSDGMAQANPTLNCMIPGPCRYLDSGEMQGMPPVGTMFLLLAPVPANSKLWFISADLTLRHQLMNSAETGTLDGKNNDPYAKYGPDGTAVSYWNCPAEGVGREGGPQYPCLFRPDNPAL